MILVDTSVWIDHFRAADAQLVALPSRNQVLAHPFIVGEIAFGGITKRAEVLRFLQNLPKAVSAKHAEVMTVIDRHNLVSSGIGYVDANLLAGVALSPGAALWSRDKSLRAAAVRLGLAPTAALN